MKNLSKMFKLSLKSQFLMAGMLLGAMLFFSHFAAYAEDETSSQSILSVAKIAGACGILNSMIDFQKSTKMDGGDEFVTKFWATESARLGITVQQMSDRCDKAIGLYGKLWAATEQNQEEPKSKKSE